MDTKWRDGKTLMSTWNYYKDGYKSFNKNKIGTTQYKKPPNPPSPLGRHPFNIITKETL